MKPVVTVDFPSADVDVPEQCKAESCSSALLPNFTVKPRDTKGLGRIGLVPCGFPLWALLNSCCRAGQRWPGLAKPWGTFQTQTDPNWENFYKPIFSLSKGEQAGNGLTLFNWSDWFPSEKSCGCIWTAYCNLMEMSELGPKKPPHPDTKLDVSRGHCPFCESRFTASGKAGGWSS